MKLYGWWGVVLSVGLVLPGAVYGQGKLPAGAAQAIKKVTKESGKKAVLSPGARAMHALRESPMFRSIKPTRPEQLRVFFPELENLQKKALLARYYKTMEDFTAFKRELDVRLFYQTLPGEGRPFAQQEKQEIFKQMGDLSSRIRALKAGPFRADPALARALDYLNEAAGRVEPMFQNMFGSKEWPRGKRVYQISEFMLEAPKRSVFSSQVKEGRGAWFAYSRCRRIMESLPVKKVAVVNDDPSLLTILEHWYKRGGFGSKSQWVFYGSAQAAQRAIKLGEQFDLILTDVLVPGGGGPLLAAELRQRNIPTPLIALTQYQPNKHTAAWLYSAGFDGMISISPYFGDCGGDMLLLAQKIQNYFFYRNLHQWEY